MIENLLEALQNLNYNDVQTLDLTKEEDNKKFKDAIEIIKNYKKEVKNDSIMSFLVNLIDDDLLNKAEEYADNILEKVQGVLQEALVTVENNRKELK